MNRPQPWLLIGGALTLLLTNAVVLVGVGVNRRAPTDSLFTLSERELAPQWSWVWRQGENSGLNLRLRYRVESARPLRGAEPIEGLDFPTYTSYGPVAWLDRDKLRALGFDVPEPQGEGDAEAEHRLWLEREVFLVLEMDGPVRARVLQAARERVALREREGASGSAPEGHVERLEGGVRVALQREEQQESRLFVVDAGLEPDALRKRYPDRTHYAVVHGSVRLFATYEGGEVHVRGSVSAVRCESINVPVQFRSAVAEEGSTDIMAMALGRAEPKRQFTVQVAFGRRFEPWIVAARAGRT
jgi:hypothetical protein